MQFSFLFTCILPFQVIHSTQTFRNLGKLNGSYTQAAEYVWKLEGWGGGRFWNGSRNCEGRGERFRRNYTVSRPLKEPAERICPICKIEMENKYHFLNICPAYQEKRCSLLDYLEKECRIKIRRMSPNKIFMFLINPSSGNVKIQKLIAKHIFECFEKRKGEDG